MISNYYTLIAVANEMKQLIGSKMLDCFTQENDSCVLALYDGSVIHNLFFSADSSTTALYIDRKFSKARKNITTLFKPLEGDYLQSVELIADDRIIQIQFIEHKIYFHLFGAGKANAILCKKDDKIIDSLIKLQIEESSKYELKPNDIPCFNDFLGSEKVISALSKCDLLLGKLYAKQLLFEKNIDEETRILQLFEDEKLELLKLAETKIQSIVASREYYIYFDDEIPILSLIKLENYGEIKYTFNSISDAVKKARILKIKQKLDSTLRREAVQSLTSEKQRLERKIIECKNWQESIARAEKYNHIAGLLLSQPNGKSKPGDRIVVNDYDGTEISVELDKKLNLIENAQKYFLKAKKSNQDAKIKQSRLPLLEEKISRTNALIQELEEISDIKKLRIFIENLKTKRIAKRMENWKKTPEEKFKTYSLSDGYTLYVGKNAANNDELTMKFAKPNDLWLHARGTSGSHAVLKMKSDTKPPKQVLQAAAEITAYYSSARNGKYVPVCYTQKKYVRKPKGASPGSVVIAREELVMVEPKLPQAEII